jgi:F-type H+-transporting ATPase subunit epsilon
MELTIVTPHGIDLQTSVESVVLPGLEGEMTILNEHAPIITLLKKGTIYFDVKGKRSARDIHGGIAHLEENNLRIILHK